MVRGLGVVLALVAVGMLSACSIDDQSMSESRPSVASQRPTASDDELTSAAKKVYRSYLRAVQVLSESGSDDYSRLRPYLSPEALATESESLDRLAARGIRTEGPTRLRAFEAQRVDPASGEVVAYACVDLAEVRVLDERGDDITPATRPDLQTFAPSFSTVNGHLVLSENGTWSGESIC